ncbi:hypothetical protein BDBG_04216 [Blastomyces gilchristii SLH14081]|uniref:Restriction of telomere capping protein 4 n=1 Tax=Blastomyces gilchristii (strain SLH14081) TaxID=559298 RepID=A0A179UM80_BLAGS|nr:uncharacterized protein BDBG_04216 [Blastomyces gilchristii SLH14081]OAT08247.1 hypothetical protein BDBG_04216 [Blastomyces gilchristii SLH14081]
MATLQLTGTHLKTVSFYHNLEYYGPKAADILGEEIAYLFTSDLREAAIQKSLVQKCGIAMYILKMLVPEVLTKFVAEDMMIDDDKTRSILEQSNRIGECLNNSE